MSRNNTIYIPDDVKSILLKNFPISKKLLSFLNKQRINKAEDLANLDEDLFDSIISNVKDPFPELRQIILGLQERNSEDQVLTLQNQQTNANNQDFFDDPKLSGLNVTYVSIEDLTGFINKCLSEFDDEDNARFLGRLGVIGDTLTTEEVSVEYKKYKNIVHKDGEKIYVELNKNIISIPQEIEEIHIGAFPISKQLENYLIKNKINVTKDFQRIGGSTLKEIFNSTKSPFPELRCFLVVLQHVAAINQYILANHEDDELPHILSVEEFIKFINLFTLNLEAIEQKIFLGLYGGLSEDKIQSLNDICRKNSLYSISALKIIKELKERFVGRYGDVSKRLLTELNDNCKKQLCPLTPNLIVELTGNKFELFEYYPQFYIRLFKECFPPLNILPSISSHNFHLNEDENFIVKQMVDYLEELYLPISLSQIFNNLNFANHVSSSTDVFFEAIQSPKFNLIQGDKPNELYIELSYIK